MKYVFFILLSLLLISCSKIQSIEPISIEKPSSNNILMQTTPVKNSIKETPKNIATEPTKIRSSAIDSDKDGIVDQNDRCPNTSNDFIVDNEGCPQTSTLKIKFVSKQFDVTPEILKELEGFASFLKKNKSYQVIIYGYTDSIGDKIKNKLLSQRRANAIKEGLMSHGISATKLTAIGKGEANPIADNMYAKGREKNRRIEIELIK